MKKSKREIEAALDDLGAGRRDEASYAELINYLAAMGDGPEDLPLPTEVYTDEILNALDATIPYDDLPGDLTREDFTGLERYGLAFLGEDIRRGILKMRLARGGRR